MNANAYFNRKEICVIYFQLVTNYKELFFIFSTAKGCFYMLLVAGFSIDFLIILLKL